jgi:hypothetical protein
MDGEYIQYLKQEAAASIARAATLVANAAIYGMIAVYIFSTFVVPGELHKVVAVLSRSSEAAGESQEESDLL